MSNTKEIAIGDLIADTRNANLGTEQGQELLEKSVRDLGLGRSIVADRNGHIIAGNKTLQTAQSLGVDKVVVVETAGDTLVVVQRTDLDIDSKKGRELALADNQVSDKNLCFDEQVVNELSKDFNIDLEKWGFGISTEQKVNAINEQDEWQGMPEFELGLDPYKLIINFENEADRERFVKQYNLDLTSKLTKAWSTWWPVKSTGFQSSELKYE